MFRTMCVCALTAAACFAVVAGTRFAVPQNSTKRIHDGESAYFPVVDLYCLPEQASGAPRFHEPGVACHTGAHEYTGRHKQARIRGTKRSPYLKRLY
jgi:hypothetical protein